MSCIIVIYSWNSILPYNWHCSNSRHIKLRLPRCYEARFHDCNGERRSILWREDDIVTFLVLTLQHFTGSKIRCKNVQQNRNRCCATRGRKYKSFLLIITPAVFKYHSVTSCATNYEPHCCLERDKQQQSWDHSYCCKMYRVEMTRDDITNKHR